MMQEPELEEGEACFKDDTSIDPDIALSYLDDKVQSILGHLRKDFEGGVLAENLGAKFGGYGSFLPMHQRSPPIWAQPKSQERVQNPHFPRSPNHLSPEDPVPNSITDDPTQSSVDPSPCLSALRTVKSSSWDDLVRQKTASSSDNVAEAFPGRVKLPSKNSGDPPDQRTLKVQIKVGPDRAALYNAEIYNLGLTSPSSSEENCHDESDELMFESHESPKESPRTILQIMTSSPVSGGLWLSPLCEELLNLARETEYAVENTCEAPPTTFSVRLPNNDVQGGNQNNIVEKSSNFEKSKDEIAMDLNDGKRKTLSSNYLDHSLHPFCEFTGKASSNAIRESKKDAQMKIIKENKDKVKANAVSRELVRGASLERTSDQSCGKSDPPESRHSSIEKDGKHRATVSNKDVSVDHGKCSKTPGNMNGASSIVYSNNSEGVEAKGAKDNLSLKVSLNAASNKCNGSETLTSHAANRSVVEGKSKGSQTRGKLPLKVDSLRDGGCVIPENKSNGRNYVRKLHLSQKDVVRTGLDHVDNPKHLMESPSGGKQKELTLGAAKAKPAHANKLKQQKYTEKNYDKMTPGIKAVDPLVAAVDYPMADPAVILDNWVGCDHCGQWRLLPYGVQSNQLPEKWVCSMLDWLPGMNHCDIREDETTKAVQDLYLVPVPENQLNNQTHEDGATAGGISADHHNRVYEPMKKQKLKVKQNTASMIVPGLSNGKRQLQRLPVKIERSKDVKQSLDGALGANATNKTVLQHPNNAVKVVARSRKRKSEHMIEDDANPRKKILKMSAQHAEGKLNKIKPKEMGATDTVLNCHNLTSDSPNKTVKKDGIEKGTQKDTAIGRVDNFRSHGKIVKEEMKHLPDGHVGLKACNGTEVSTKRIKLKHHVDDWHEPGTWQNNGSNLHDRELHIKEDSDDGYFHKNPKFRVSQIEEEFKGNHRDGMPKRKGGEPRNQFSGTKEYSISRDIEKEEKVSKPRGKLRLTAEDIDKLKKDLGCEQLSTTATSSSSKVSDSGKNRNRSVGVKESPEESVSSSPVRMPRHNEVSLMMKDKVGELGSRFSDERKVSHQKKYSDVDENFKLGAFQKRAPGLINDNGSEILDLRNKFQEETGVAENCCAPKHEVSSSKRLRLSNKSSIKAAKQGTSINNKKDLGKTSDSKREDQPVQREHDDNAKMSNHPASAGLTQHNLTQDFPRSSTEQIPTTMEPRKRKLQVDSRQGDEQGALCSYKHESGSLKSSVDASSVGNTSKASKDHSIAYFQNGPGTCINNDVEQPIILDGSLGNKNICGVSGYTTLKEAEDVLKAAEELRNHADLIKNSGFNSESNYEYFKAALKFLHGTSLLEACIEENSKRIEMSPMQLYGTSAKLFKTCAYEYEKGHEMAAAALAFKCMEVAYLRVVYCKTSAAQRFLHDLQSSLPMVPLGESPSSSASNVDNLNYLAAVDKATLAKGPVSQTGNNLILAHNCPNFVRLLEFTKDVNSAMETVKKSQNAFSAAVVELEKSQNTEAIIAIKKVIEFSFQNVDEFVRLVSLAFNTTNHQDLSGRRD